MPELSRKKRYNKIKSFLQQVKQGPYYICTICHRNLYQHSVRLSLKISYSYCRLLSSSKIFYILNILHDKKFYICETCHKHLHKNEIPCQAVCNKTALDIIPEELRHLKNWKKS